MNRELFISDFKRLSRQWSGEALPQKLADYVRGMVEHPVHSGQFIKVSPDLIISVCEKHFSRSFEELKKRNRRSIFIYPREVIMYLLYRRTTLCYEDIGRLFERDHTTVISANRRIKMLILTDDDIAAEIKYLNAQLTA